MKTTVEQELEAIVLEYGQQGQPYNTSVTDSGDTILKIDRISRRLLLQLIAMCDRRNLQCVIGPSASTGLIMFQAIDPYSNENQEP